MNEIKTFERTIFIWDLSTGITSAKLSTLRDLIQETYAMIGRCKEMKIKKEGRKVSRKRKEGIWFLEEEKKNKEMELLNKKL